MSNFTTTTITSLEKETLFVDIVCADTGQVVRVSVGEILRGYHQVVDMVLQSRRNPNHKSPK